MPATSTKPTIKILYAESDEDVMATQTAAMKKAGHHVSNAIGRQAVQEALRRDAFDLVILGSTLTKEDRHHLPYMVKKAHEGTKVLVMHADRIFVLERGHIVEFGRHSELLDQKGLYYAMWRQQVGEREAIAANS